MRTALLWAVGIELLLVLAGVLKLRFVPVRTDLAGQGMAKAMGAIAAVVALVLLLPALLLAVNGTLLWLALCLVVLGGLCSVAVLAAG